MFKKLILISLIIMFGIKASEQVYEKPYIFNQINKLINAATSFLGFNKKDEVPIIRDYLVIVIKVNDNNFFLNFFDLEKLTYSESLQNILLNKSEFIYISNQKVYEKIIEFNLQKLGCFVVNNKFVFQFSENKFVAFDLEENFQTIEASIVSSQQMKALKKDIFVGCIQHWWKP